MTLPRDYTLAEIDAMRDATHRNLAKERNLPLESVSLERVEDRLRTYMMAGVTLADLRGGVVKEADPFEDELMWLAGGVINVACGKE